MEPKISVFFESSVCRIWVISNALDGFEKACGFQLVSQCPVYPDGFHKFQMFFRVAKKSRSPSVFTWLQAFLRVSAGCKWLPEASDGFIGLQIFFARNQKAWKDFTGLRAAWSIRRIFEKLCGDSDDFGRPWRLQKVLDGPRPIMETLDVHLCSFGSIKCQWKHPRAVRIMRDIEGIWRRFENRWGALEPIGDRWGCEKTGIANIQEPLFRTVQKNFPQAWSNKLQILTSPSIENLRKALRASGAIGKFKRIAVLKIMSIRRAFDSIKALRYQKSMQKWFSMNRMISDDFESSQWFSKGVNISQRSALISIVFILET